MGSTDSAGSAHTGGSSCGLVSSLFPNSCRGRAEAFARRLHRRLTSLGGEENAEDDDEHRGSMNKATETSWLHAPTGHRTTTSAPSNSATSLTSSINAEERIYDSQPHHSLESEIYYELDLHPDDRGSNGIISPAEIASLADIANIHVNSEIPKPNNSESGHSSTERRPGVDRNQISETECVFSSPLTGISPDTDNSDLYFDPQTSDTDKCRLDGYFDPQGTSESEVTSNLSNKPDSKETKLPGRRKNEKGIDSEVNKRQDDTSDSSTSSWNVATLENTRSTGNNVHCSSEESLNGRSSLETTSPSHESLWSTFDENTVSLQDESTSGPSSVPATVETKFLKSHSDSEIGCNSSLSSTERDEVDFPTNTRCEDEAPLTNGLREDSSPFIYDSKENDASSYNSRVNTPGTLTPKSPTGRKVTTNEENIVKGGNIRIIDANSTKDIAKLLAKLACSQTIDKIVRSDHEDEKMNENEENKECTEVCGEKSKVEVEAETEVDRDEEEIEDDQDEEEDERPQRVRRCSSLKTGKTPPSTPGRKKIVRFADVLGLDLADVRTYLDEIPKVPNSAYSDLIYDEAFQKDSSPVSFRSTGSSSCFTTSHVAATMPKGAGPISGVRIDRSLVPLFQQPGGLPGFLDLVRERQVCLENVVVEDPITMCIRGIVRVRNLDFHKSVHVRYTLDSWRNFSDLQAMYAVNSCDGFSDKFTFVLYCHTLKIGQRLELAVRFQCKGTQYWDNNKGVNYCFQCLPASNANPGYIPITSTQVNNSDGNSTAHEWSPTFY